MISEWLTRSQNVPLTIIAEFTDTYEHLPCRYGDSPTATVTNTNDLGVCPRHKAVLSLDQLLPHRSRIHHLNILFHPPDLDLDDDDDDEQDDGDISPALFCHPFFMETLPNLQSLDFRATHVDQRIFTFPVSESLFAGELPRLKELTYLGATGGPLETSKNLLSCRIGTWSGSLGPYSISPAELQTLFRNNTTARALSLEDCELYAPGHPFTGTTPMTNLRFLKILCPFTGDFNSILESIHTPQFKSLDTARLSLFSHSVFRVVATDGFSHRFEFSQSTGNNQNFYPLRYLEADITALRLDRGITLSRLDSWAGPPGLHKLFRSFGAVRTLEFDGALASVKNVLYNILPIAGVFPELKVIRVAFGWDDCEEVLQFIAAIAKLRMEEGNPLVTIEPFVAEDSVGTVGGGGLGQELRAEWEKYYEAEGVQNFLSE